MDKITFIKSLIETAQTTVWKNELALAYNEKFGDGKDKEEKEKSGRHAIEKDLAYIKFLEEQCELLA